MTAAATFVVAIAVALSVPVSQLRTITIVTECCCPDPSNCHCPDHKPDSSKQSSLRACHRTAHDIISPEAPAFVAPQLAFAAAPQRAAEPAILALADPHAAPAPARPDVPS